MDWITTANGLIALITGLVGLIGTGIGAFFAIKGYIQAAKEKSAQQIWAAITTAADAAMHEAERQWKESGGKVDRKALVLSMVQAGCASDGLDISAFLTQLSTYIDDCIKFVKGFDDNSAEEKAE